MINNLAKNKIDNFEFLDALLETLFDIPDDFIQIKRTVTDVIDEIAYVLKDK